MTRSIWIVFFSPFQRLHGRGRYAGTGMGLAICRRIVERHHGQLTARSRPGEGATFIVQLPLTQPPDAVPPSSSTAHA
nr:ATP-binding protein [Rhodothermus marinus]